MVLGERVAGTHADSVWYDTGTNLDEGTSFASQDFKDENVLAEHIEGVIPLFAVSHS